MIYRFGNWVFYRLVSLLDENELCYLLIPLRPRPERLSQQQQQQQQQFKARTQRKKKEIGPRLNRDSSRTDCFFYVGSINLFPLFYS